MPAGVSAITPLANLTLGTSATTVTFSSIVGTYRDLILVAVCRSNAQNSVGIRLSMNTTPTTRYNALRGSGAAAASMSNSTSYADLGSGYITLDTSEWMQLEIHLMDYAQTNKNKCGITKVNKAGSGGTLIQNFNFETTTAVTSLVIYPAFDAFAAGSTFALYGIEG